MIDIKRIFNDYIESEFNISILGKSFKRNDWIKEKRHVHKEFQKIFSFKNIEKLTEKDFSKFLNYKNNISWTGLHRHKTKIIKDLEKLKDALQYLVNEKIPIEERINKVVQRDGEYHIEGMGVAIITAILHVTNPELYGVWNNTSYEALNLIERLPRVIVIPESFILNFLKLFMS